MDSTLIANLENTPAVQSYLQKNTEYYNTSSPLFQAQVMSNAYMSLKPRTPMVIEYYGSKDPTTKQCIPVTVELYINPNKLTIGTQKVKDKKYTRGGIFYHHWGDDHWTMNISGVLGYAGMKGIEQLEKIYHASGTLLRYQTYGPSRVYSGDPSNYINTIDFSNPMSGFEYMLGHNIPKEVADKIKATYSKLTQVLINNSPLTNTFYDQKMTALGIKMMTSYQNAVQNAQDADKFADVFKKSTQYYSDNVLKNKFLSFDELFQYTKQVTIQDFPNANPDLQHSIAYDITGAVLSSVTDPNSDLEILKASVLPGLQNDIKKLDEWFKNNFGGSPIPSKWLPKNLLSGDYYEMGELRGWALQRAVSEVQRLNEGRRISRSLAQSGWTDIRDELEDEWRPRQVWIYFEDRVYIGHFDSFNYSRVAEHPLIQYDMKFTVTRQVIVTSTSSTAIKPFASKTGSSSSIVRASTVNPGKVLEPWEAKVKYYATKTDQAIEDAKFEILKSKNMLIYETKQAQMSGDTINAARAQQIRDWITQIQDAAGINKNDAVFGASDMTEDQRLDFFGLGNGNQDVSASDTGIVFQVINNSGILVTGVLIQPMQDGKNVGDPVKTDTNGNAKFTLKAGSYVFRMTAAGNSNATITRDEPQPVEEGKMPTVQITMDVPAPTVTGSVKITVRNNKGDNLNDADVSAVLQNPAPGNTATPITQKTNATGQCMLSGIPIGTYKITISYNNVSTEITTEITETTNSDIPIILNVDKLVETGIINITVVDKQNTSKVLKGVTVQATANGQNVHPAEMTDDNGLARFSDLPYDNYIFKTTLDGVTNASNLVVLNSPLQTLKLQFDKTVQQGTAVIKIAKNGNGVPDLIIEAYQGTTMVSKSKSDSFGNATFVLNAGDYTFKLSSDANYKSFPVNGKVTAQTTTNINFPIQDNLPPGTLNVTVVDQNRAIIKGATITIKYSTTFTATGTSGDDGKYTTSLDANTYIVTAKLDSDTSQEFTAIVTSGQTTNLQVQIITKPTYGSVRILVQDKDTNAVNDASVLLTPRTAGVNISSFTRMTGGYYMMTNVPVKSYDLTVTWKDQKAYVTNIQVQTNKQTDVNVKLTFSTVAQGTVVVVVSGDKNNITLPATLAVQVKNVSTGATLSQYNVSNTTDTKNKQTDPITLTAGDYNFVVANHGSSIGTITDGQQTTVKIDYTN